MLLSCDLGGSCADWAIHDSNSGEIIVRKNFDLAESEDFDEMLDREILPWVGKLFISPISATCLGVAGRVEDGFVKLTNVEGWEVRSQNISAILADHGHAPKVHIINDFEAISLGVVAMMRGQQDKSRFTELHGRYKSAIPRPGEIRGTRSTVCGPGTGLGVACLIGGDDANDLPLVLSSEGGHHSLAPESVEQYRFVGHFNKSVAKVSYEDALSKQGLRNIYNYYRKENYSLDQDFGISANKIVDLACNGRDLAATDSLSLFCEILANFCGNLALTFNTDRAIFLWGGLLLNMPVDLLKSRFKQHYAERCMHSDRIHNLPVVLLRDNNIPLNGCALKCLSSD